MHSNTISIDNKNDLYKFPASPLISANSGQKQITICGPLVSLDYYGPEMSGVKVVVVIPASGLIECERI